MTLIEALYLDEPHTLAAGALLTALFVWSVSRLWGHGEAALVTGVVAALVGYSLGVML